MANEDLMRITVLNAVNDPSPFVGHIYDGVMATVTIDGVTQSFRLSKKDSSGWPPGWAVETMWWAVKDG